MFQQRVPFRRVLSGLALVTAVTLQIPVASAADLTIKVKRAPATCGPFLVALYGSEESFLKEPDFRQRAEKARGTSMAFKALPAGRYAVAAYCDNNGNGELDKGAFGRPLEPLAFSRNAKGMMGPPSFEDASFVVGSDDVEIALKVR